LARWDEAFAIARNVRWRGARKKFFVAANTRLTCAYQLTQFVFETKPPRSAMAAPDVSGFRSWPEVAFGV
jgi:hypothetical protein